MSNPEFVVAAYAIVIGGLSMYVVSIRRRVQAARRTAETFDRERRTDASIPSPALTAEPTGQPPEAPR